ncbi:hypothetical protein BU17DRAFT_70510 [Hysterangium stoloniferum]|nr:hypothetical protein BU17DRAFT_70510 [Hysterangium stoloniferum]
MRRDEQLNWGGEMLKWGGEVLKWGDEVLKWGDEVLKWGDEVLKWGDEVLKWGDELLKWADEELKWSTLPQNGGGEPQIGNEESPSRGGEPQIGNDDSRIRDGSQTVEDEPECGDDESNKARHRYRSLLDATQREARELSLERVKAIAHHIEGNRTTGTLQDLVTEGENGRLDSKWTTIHAVFVIMGGFHAYNDGKPLYPLTSKEVVELVRAGPGMGQGDWLSKGITATQTVWFMVQCIARRMERLPITQLEIMTLAYTTITVTMYAFWWLKPLNVNCPLRIAITKPLRKSTESKWPLYPASKVVWTIAGWQDNLMSMEQVWETRSQVPTFYGGGGKGNPSKTIEMKECWPDLIGLAATMLFGAIHCVVWSYVFSSIDQRRLWHGRRSTKYPTKYVHWPVEGIAMLSAAFSFLLYLTARLILLVLAFTTLTSLPPDACRTVEWTLHIPHIA